MTKTVIGADTGRLLVYLCVLLGGQVGNIVINNIVILFASSLDFRVVYLVQIVFMF